jgi:hypothetical protein
MTGTCPECGRGYVRRRTVTFSTDRPDQEQFVHERETLGDVTHFLEYCMGEVVG